MLGIIRCRTLKCKHIHWGRSCLTIIIVPDWQGKGLGRALIDLARVELAKAGCTKFFLMSDCNSDWQFYEHLNMKRILEDHSQDTGDGFIVYMYGGDTQD